ncbi:MAG: hypothetical protein JKY96_03860, partial [Phycisphaerales bacterium]|nr:hypothetical protein [Phycisphaerales bacterium]
MPIFLKGDVLYADGEPVYNDGADLKVVSKFEGLYYGDQSVARFITKGQGVRMAITSDSQFSGGLNRGLMGIAQTWPFTFSSLPISTAATDPFYIARQSPTDYLLSSSWHNLLTRTNVENTYNSRILRDSGINKFSEIPLQFLWVSRPQTPNVWSGSIFRANEQQRVMYDPKNWVSDEGVLLKMHLAFIQGGETDLSGENGSWDFSLRFQHFMPGTGELLNDDWVVASPSKGVSQVSLDKVENGGAMLTMVSSDVLASGVNTVNSWIPQCIVRELDSVDDADIFILPGWVERFSNLENAEPGFGISLVRTAAGRNPECFLYGADNGNSVLTNHGSNKAIREWMWNNYNRPNTLFYSFGHNGPVRDIAHPRAASVYQADLFDLIYQDCNDLLEINGEMPMVVVFLPWVGANMNDQRQSEMLGVVKALNELGIRTLGISGYNRFGGAVFNEEFQLDAMDLHPFDENAAEIVWGEVYGLIDLASRVIFR